MQVDSPNGLEQHGFSNIHVDLNNAPEGHGFINTQPTSMNSFVNNQPAPTNGFEKIGFNGTQALAAESTNVTQAYKFDGDQTVPVNFEAGEGTGSLNLKNTTPKLGELDVSPVYLSMPSHSRSQITDAFMQVFLSSQGQELTHVCEHGFLAYTHVLTALFFRYILV